MNILLAVILSVLFWGIAIPLWLILILGVFYGRHREMSKMARWAEEERLSENDSHPQRLVKEEDDGLGRHEG